MFRFFKKKKVNAVWLADYPVYEAPHIGVGRALSEVQAEENLSYLLANKSSRIEALSTLLKTFDIDVAAGFAYATPEQLITQLYDWSGEHWGAYNRAEYTRKHWQTNQRRDDDLIYSVVMDTAIVLGDLLVQHKPTYQWGLDVDSGNAGMSSYRRCVVQAPMATDPSIMAIFDPEQMVAERVFDPNKPHWAWENQWQRAMTAYLSGAHEAEHLV